MKELRAIDKTLCSLLYQRLYGVWVKQFIMQTHTKIIEKVEKGVWGMPRLSEAMKDVISCDKLRGSAHTN